MRVLLVVRRFDCLARRVFCELERKGVPVSVELDGNALAVLQAIARFEPTIVLVTPGSHYDHMMSGSDGQVLHVHTGPATIIGDDPLRHAIVTGTDPWTVSLINAATGGIWAEREIPTATYSRNDLYRGPVTDAVAAMMQEVVNAYTDTPSFTGLKEAPKTHQNASEAKLTIDWLKDESPHILQTIRSDMGIETELLGVTCRVFDAHEEGEISGAPGKVLARRADAICVGTGDGAVWIGRLIDTRPGQPAVKLPATLVLGDRLSDIEDLSLPFDARPTSPTYRDVWYEERRGVGYIHFPFFNGATSAEQCRRLETAFAFAVSRPTRVIVLTGGELFFSTGVDLAVIEASDDPSATTRANIRAIDRLTARILSCDSHFTIAALSGTAAAAGLFMAIATDYVFLRKGVILHPHGGGMTRLEQSRQWQRMLEKRVCRADASAMVEDLMPIDALSAQEMGLADAVFGNTVKAFHRAVRDRAERLAGNPEFDRVLDAKRTELSAQERPLTEDNIPINLEPGFDEARRAFLAKRPGEIMPSRLARHRELK